MRNKNNVSCFNCKHIQDLTDSLVYDTDEPEFCRLCNSCRPETYVPRSLRPNYSEE